MSKRGKGETCAYCRRTLEAVGGLSGLAATRDHTVPRMLGGTRTVWACRQCNVIKGGMTPWSWTKFMAANPEWWKREEYKLVGNGYKKWRPPTPQPMPEWLKELQKWSQKNSVPLARNFFRTR